MANSMDRVESLITVPESSRKLQAVTMGAKLLETMKETRKVIPEEEYVDNLEKIIVRDYFPELPKLKAQSEYMEAVARNDHLKIRELQIRYSTTRRRTDRRTSPTARPSSPSVFDPDSPGRSSTVGTAADRLEASPYANDEGDNDDSSTKKKRKKKTIDDLTVQTYLDRYTSEDNAAFEELAQLHNKRERVRNAWMYAAEERHNAELVYRAAAPAIAADEQLVARNSGEVEKPAALDNWTYRARNTVLFNALDEAPLTMAEWVERTKQNEKIINKAATRFDANYRSKPQKSVMARAALQQAAAHAGQVDVTGKELGVVPRATLGIIATPSPAPGVEDSPMMTWGEIEGTPFRLDEPDITAAYEDAPIFKIPAVPVRERVAHDMAEQIARRYRGKRKAAVNQLQKIVPKTPTFNSSRSSGKLSVMSPAARRFATDKLGIRIGTDKLKLSGSPFNAGKSPHSRAMFSPALYNMTRVKQEAGTPLKQAGTSSSVTDNLFNLPPSPVVSPCRKPTADPSVRPVSSANATAPQKIIDTSSAEATVKSSAGSSRPSAADFF